jgi:superfamily II DNA helicase RecQ
MTSQQTVIVVVPFAALVDDIIVRGQAAGLHCEEWLDEKSGHELQQLIVVSADRAVQGEFLHYAKGLEISGQLAHVFFDECHVAFTDTSYRERLRELWRLRYLDCPFTGLTATLMVELEDVLRERLCIDNAEVFRRNTSRRTIRYQVSNSGDKAPSVVAAEYAQGLQLPREKRGVVYVRSYATGGAISTALKCPFYKARADDKGEVLQQWIEGCGGWIVATGALGTGVNIEGIIHVVHVDRPYGLTSFVQQSGRGGRNGEVSDSMIITRVQNSSGRRRGGIMNEYSVEQIDEDAMTEFIQARTCRRQVLSRYFDGKVDGTDCKSTDSVFCDRCKGSNRPGVAGRKIDIRMRIKEEEGDRRAEEEGGIEEEEANGAQVIQQRLKASQERHERMIGVMDRLQGRCIYCELINGGRMGESISQGRGSQGQLHTYGDCFEAEASGCGFVGYEAWREGVDLGEYQHCWKCGLSQKVCRRLEDDGWCEYPEIMLPGIFILERRKHLQGIVETVGFQGDYGKDVWDWLKEVKEGFGQEWESNWMGTWRQICEMDLMMRRGAEEEAGLD